MFQKLSFTHILLQKCVHLNEYSNTGGVITIDEDADVSHLTLPTLLDNSLTTLIINSGVTVSSFSTYFPYFQIVDLSKTDATYADFRYCKLIKKVILPSTMTTISSEAFAGTPISEINMDYITEIGPNAFYSCKNLRTINLNKVTKISESSFELSGIEAADLSSLTDTTIPKSAFASCSQLKTVTLPSDKQFVLSENSFYHCQKLTTITGTVQKVGVNALSYSGITTITFAGSDLACDTSSFENSAIQTVQGPEGLITIDSKAFMNCYKLKSFSNNLVPSLKLYSTYAFKNCVLLTLSNIKVTNAIDRETFCNCKSLTTINIDTTSTSLTFNDMAFFACDKLTKFTVSSSVKEINYNERSFGKCSSLTSVPIMSTVYDYVFIDCVKLVLPETIDTPGTGSFMGLNAITSVKITGSVINKYAFMRCLNLKSVVIQEANKISESAFNGCPSLTSVTFPSNSFDILPYAFYGTGLTSVDVSKALSIGAAAFQNTKLQTVTFGNYFGSQSSPENQPFYNLSTLTKIVLTSTATQFFIEPFLSCENLATITLNSNFINTNGTITSSDGKRLICVLPTANISHFDIPNVETIQKYAFQSNQFLLSAAAYFPNTLSYTFYNCRNLESFAYTPDAAQKDPLNFEGTFMDCTKLKTVTLSGNIQTIGDSTFRNCIRLVDFVIPDTVSSIGQYSFANTYKIRNLTLNGVTKIGSYAFYGSYIHKLTNGKSLKTIDTYAFANSKISSINLPNYLTTIGKYAFYKAEKLTSITLPNIYEIQSNTFAGTHLTQINIPASVQNVAKDAFDHIFTPLKFTFPSGGHPKFTVYNDHEFVDKVTKTLLFTFGNLTRTYKISNSVKNIDQNSIYTNMYEQRDTGYSYDIGVQTLIFPSTITTFDSNYFASSSKYLRNLCFEGDVTFKYSTINIDVDNIYAPAYTGDSTSLIGPKIYIPIKREPCDQTTPYPTSYEEINDTCPFLDEENAAQPNNGTDDSKTGNKPTTNNSSGFTKLAGWMVFLVIILVVVIAGLIVLYLVNQKAKAMRREKRALARAEKLKQQQALNKEQEPQKEQLDEETKQAVEAAAVQQNDQNGQQGEGDVEKTKDNPLLTFGDTNEDAFGDDVEEPADSPLAQDENQDKSDSSDSNSDNKELEDI